MPGTDALMRNASLAGLGGIALAVALLATPGAALSQDARANSRITEADCRNRAQHERNHDPDPSMLGGSLRAAKVLGVNHDLSSTFFAFSSNNPAPVVRFCCTF